MNRINFIVTNNIVEGKRTGKFYHFPCPFNA